MIEWAVALATTGGCAGAALLLRELVIDYIAIRSLGKTKDEQKHAREMVKILKSTWRRAGASGTKKPVPKDPPALTPP